ncbi:MAG: TetR/AcrR family transcriptional regulator [Proteobacteria bacterium]|nr:TetR/AcrR family transcriptional regulator [Pseudomonadota bacterium]
MTCRETHAPAPRLGLRERNKAKRKRAILEATRELLRSSPEREPSKEEIAELAEVAPATVYNLVGHRHRIWQALAADFTDRLEAELESAPARDPIAQVRRIIELTVSMFVGDPVVNTWILRRWEHSGLVLERGPIGPLQRALRAAQDAGCLRKDVGAGILASNIATASVGALHQWAAGQLDDAQLRQRIRFATEVTLAAVAPDVQRRRLLTSLRRYAREVRT